MRRGQRGAVLMEVALALPFTVALFLGLSDFSLFFWRQTQMEEVARIAAVTIQKDPNGFAAADSKALDGFSNTLRGAAERDSGLVGVTVTLTRHYACPLPSGGEETLTDHPQLCPGERVYASVVSTYRVTPMLRPLSAAGFPDEAKSRTFVRLY